MIKLEHVVLASPEQMKFIIEGMRNPMNSWEKSDSRTCRQDGAFCMECEHKNNYCLGENDHSLMQRLSKAGTDHRKFMRMLPVYVRITAPLYGGRNLILIRLAQLLTAVVPCIKSRLRNSRWMISVVSILWVVIWNR